MTEQNTKPEFVDPWQFGGCRGIFWGSLISMVLLVVIAVVIWKHV